MSLAIVNPTVLPVVIFPSGEKLLECLRNEGNKDDGQAFFLMLVLR